MKLDLLQSFTYEQHDLIFQTIKERSDMGHMHMIHGPETGHNHANVS